jgi:K+-sensing histidine kinase KdpD
VHDEQTVLVCVTGQKTCDRLIKTGAQLAAGFLAPLLVVHVAPAGAPLLGSSTQSEALNYLYSLSCEVGAEMAVLRAPDTLERLIQYAQEQHVAHIVIGAGRPDGPDRRDVASLLRMRLPHIQVHVVIL